MLFIKITCQCGRINGVAIPHTCPAKVDQEKSLEIRWYSRCQCGQVISLALPEPLPEKEKQDEELEYHYYHCPHFWALVWEDNDPGEKLKVDPNVTLEYPRAAWKENKKGNRPKADPSSILQFPELVPVENKKEAKPQDNAIATLPFSQPAPVESEKGESARAECSHSPDFRSVIWMGEGYTFTETQAKVVKPLWEAWEKGKPVISQRLALKKSGSYGTRLRDLFKRSKAWNKMIKPVGKGMIRLAG